MPGKFGESNDRGRRSPPDYRSRSVRVRLFVLVTLVMLVLIAMQRVSDPQFWSFMGFENGRDSRVPEAMSREKVDSRVRETPRARANSVHDAFQLPDETLWKSGEPDMVQPGREFQFTQQDGWEYVHGGLKEDQRLMLHKVLRNARQGTALTSADREIWIDLLGELDDRWRQFHLDNRTAVSQSATAGEERQVWEQTLARSESHWGLQVRPALALAAEGKSLNKNQIEWMEETQGYLDVVELKRVEDNTYLSRIREKNAWFRLFDRLNAMTREQLEEAGAVRVGFLQLFRQPGQYRGKLVTIQGTARLGYHVQAPSNIYGIEGFYVYWVEPRGMPDQLVTVYALHTPAGFPELKDKDIDQVKTKLFEQVEFTGFFFKNYNYRTNVGSNVAPLLLAKSPTWELPQETAQLPPRVYFVLGFAVLALVAIGVSVFAYVRSRATSPLVAKYGVSARARPQRLKQLENESVTADIGEKLRRLESEPEDG